MTRDATSLAIVATLTRDSVDAADADATVTDMAQAGWEDHFSDDARSSASA
jgi:hypothetical protein